MTENSKKETNEKIIMQAEENAEDIETTETADAAEEAQENDEISLMSTSGDETGDIELPSLENFEMHNAFTGNEHVSPANGSLTYKKTLFTMKGIGGFDLPITISYNSTDANTVYYDYAHPYKIAQGWYLCFDGIIYNLHTAPPKTSNAAFKFADGSSYRILNRTSGISLSRYTKQDLDLNFERAIWANGITETFNSRGGITQITDRFGNGYTFEYDNNTLLKIKALNDETNCVSFEWEEYKSLTVSYGRYKITINLENGFVSSIKDGDNFVTSFNYTEYDGEYYYYIYDIQWAMYLPQFAQYYPLTEIIYPTGGKRKYTYSPMAIRGSSEGNYAVQKEELYDDDTVVDTVTYAYQGQTYSSTDIIKLNDFEGYPLTYVDRSSWSDNGKTITYYNFDDMGFLKAKEVYIKGSTTPYSKTLYAKSTYSMKPAIITTGFYNGTDWITETESYSYEAYHDLIKSKTDKAGRKTVYTYDIPNVLNKGYCLPKSESYQGITKTSTISEDGKKILGIKTVYSDKTVENAYTYDEAMPCNVINEKKLVNGVTVSEIGYDYTDDKRYVCDKNILNISSNIEDRPYSYDSISYCYSHDDLGRVSFTTEGYGYNHYAYDYAGRLRSHTIENHSISSADYSNFISDRYCVKECYYNEEEKTFKKKYCFDSLGRMVKEINMLNLDNGEYNEYTVNSYEYTGKNLTKVTSGFGSYTVYGYDPFDRVVSQSVYNSAGALQNEKTVVYDDFNRTKTVTVYGAAAVEDEIVKIPTVFEKTCLDVLGRKIKLEKGYVENGEYVVTLTTVYTYDELDRVLSTTVTGDDRALTTSNTYSQSGNLLSVTDPMGNKTVYTYNKFGKISTVKYANNAVYTYTYDTIGRLIKETDPAGNSSVNVYDSNSNIIEKYDKKGFIYSYTYDNMNRVSGYAGSINYTYIGTGALKTMTDETGTTTYSYDVNGRLTGKVTPQGEMSFTYYDNGLIKLMRDYNGARITHYYDDFGRLSRITRTVYAEDGASSSSTPVIYTYNNFGQLVLTQYPKGKTEYSYDSRNRLVKETFYTGVRNSSVAPTQVNEISYSYDDFGNIVSKVITNSYDDFGNIVSKVITNSDTDRTEYYHYDDLFRLIYHLRGVNTEKGQPIWYDSYEYDCMGNRTKHEYHYNYGDEIGQDNWTVNYTYNSLNRLLTETKTENNEAVYSYTYTYDEDGNLTNDPKTGKTYGYKWQFGKIHFIETPNVGTDEYVYNGKGELVGIKNWTGEGYETLTSEKTFMWDESGFMINEGDGTNITHGNLVGVNGIFARISDGEETYLAKNAHGDVVYTQNDLTVTKYYDYDAFGNEVNPDESDTNPFRYCGEFYDSFSNTYYLRNRLYNPRIGRFTTIDPVKSGNNWYAYCSNNPIMFIDPLGLWEEGDELYPKFVQTAIQQYTLEWQASFEIGDEIGMQKAHEFAQSARLVGEMFISRENWGADTFENKWGDDIEKILLLSITQTTMIQ